MKTSVISLRVAGSFCIMFIVFHLLFNRLFDWNHSLSCLSASDRAVMLTCHYLVILFLIFMAILTLFQTRSLLESRIKNSVLVVFALFFLFRIAAEFLFFDNSGSSSLFITVICLIPVILFIYPILKK